MTNRNRGRPTHVRTSELQTVLASDASASFKDEIAQLVQALAPHSTLDEATLREQQPVLLARVMALSPAGLDLVRVLRGETPEKARHSRQNVAASLRHVRKREGRSPLASDYPAGHVVPVLVWFYHGSFAAWGAGVSGRVQKPKRHWHQRENQQAALCQIATTHPGEAITHDLLRKAGYHSLASAVTAAEVAALVAALGLEQDLKRRTNGYWTADRLIACYAELCERLGTPMSSAMLAEAGGDGFTIRGRAAELFGSFRLFREVVGRQHSWLAPPATAQASDGTPFESWAEVACYEALRRRLPPDTGIATHVLLGPELPRCSCDFVVGRRVLIEVLMFSLAQIEAPQGATQRSYARKWTRKAAWYARTRKLLVVVEPADTVDAGRLAAKVAEVMRLLGLPPSEEGSVPCSPQGPCGPEARLRKPKGYWTERAVCRHVREVADAVGGFPTYAQLTMRGYGSAAQKLRRRGMRAQVAARIGWPLRNEKNVWTRERVVGELVAWVEAHGTYPTTKELKAAGKATLAGARVPLFPREQDVLRAEVGRRCGRVLPHRLALPGSYASRHQLVALLRPVCAALGRFPTRAEMVAAGLPSTVYRLTTRIGIAALAGTMGVPYAGPRRRTRAEVLDLLRTVARDSRPDLFGIDAGNTWAHLTTAGIHAALGWGGLTLVRKAGGIAAVRRALADQDRAGKGMMPTALRLAKET